MKHVRVEGFKNKLNTSVPTSTKEKSLEQPKCFGLFYSIEK
ncbi:hypothetical protein RV11_GL000466 [Enterococcus phoeniculicola]|nr:hypothetical protein RV11_GL000466 [Enterococcus phoeniculicola]